jgi:hypothetical protein
MPLPLAIKSGQVFGRRQDLQKVAWLKALKLFRKTVKTEKSLWLNSLEH